METIKYFYSKGQTLFITVLCAGITAWSAYILIAFHTDYRIWLYFGPLALIIYVMDFYFCKKFLLPLLLGKAALELDTEKLRFGINKKIIYWKDVKGVSYSALLHGGWVIIFSMAGGNDIRISTRYIAGNNKVIYDTILEYFEKYK